MTTPADCNLRGWTRQLDGSLNGNSPLSLITARQNLIFEDTFDGGMLDSTHWNISGNAPVVDVLDSRNCLKTTLARFVDPVSKRTEVIMKGLPAEYYDNAGQSAKIGMTFWYGFSVHLASDFVLDTTGDEIFMQWHGIPDSGEDNRNPMVALGIYEDGDTVRLSILGDANVITPPVGTNPRYDRANSYDITTVTSMRGKWTNWVFRIKWGYDNTGELTLYKNGVSVHSETGMANCFNDVKGPYWKLGLYKWPWAEGNPDTDTDTRLYYHDSIRVGNSDATLTDVWEDES